MTLDNLLALLIDAGWSALAALGFALVFNAPRRALLGCAFAGAVGHAVRTALMMTGLSLEFSTLAGALTVGLIGYVLARRLQIPVLVFTICGAIPLVPGSFAFRAMLAIINVAAATPDTAAPFLTEAAITFAKTGITLAAIAVGIAAPALIFERRKPIV